MSDCNDAFLSCWSVFQKKGWHGGRKGVTGGNGPRGGHRRADADGGGRARGRPWSRRAFGETEPLRGVPLSNRGAEGLTLSPVGAAWRWRRQAGGTRNRRPHWGGRRVQERDGDGARRKCTARASHGEGPVSLSQRARTDRPPSNGRRNARSNAHTHEIRLAWKPLKKMPYLSGNQSTETNDKITIFHLSIQPTLNDNIQCWSEGKGNTQKHRGNINWYNLSGREFNYLF